MDAAGAILLFFFPRTPERWFDLLPEQERFWPTYAAVFLTVLTALYVVSAIDPKKSIANVGVAMFGRFAGGVFYLVYCLNKPGTQGMLAVIGWSNIALLVAYWGCLQRGRWWPLFKGAFVPAR
jgi:hypothetical protein